MASKGCAKLKIWLHFSDVNKMAAILCKITNMATKARAKLETVTKACAKLDTLPPF